MGKASRWFKGLFGKKKSHERSCVCNGDSEKSSDCNVPTDSVWLGSILTDTEKERKHAFADANVAASAAEAVVSAAKAASEMVRLTSKGRLGDVIATEERWAAVKIQKIFRGSLARKALRALKGIVKLQALVRGFLVRKRAAAMLQSIQVLIRVQTAMRSKRTNRCLNKAYNMFQPRQFPDKFDESSCDERSPKIVEIDDKYMRRSSSRSKSRQVHNIVAMSEYEDDNGLELSFNDEKRKFATAHNTPRFSSSSYHNAVNNRYYVTQSQAKSVCGNGLCEYGRSVSSHGYMEKTQSFKAKLRSHSAPRQRFERKRLSLDEVMASRNSVVSMLQQQPQRYSCS